MMTRITENCHCFFILQNLIYSCGILVPESCLLVEVMRPRIEEERSWSKCEERKGREETHGSSAQGGACAEERSGNWNAEEDEVRCVVFVAGSKQISRENVDDKERMEWPGKCAQCLETKNDCQKINTKELPPHGH